MELDESPGKNQDEDRYDAPSKVSMENFELLRVLGQGAYGKVFLVRKVGGQDHSSIYAMKILKKDRLVSKPKTLEHTLAERSVLEHISQSPFLVNMYYAFQTDSKLHLVMDYVSGGELFTHLCSRGSLSFYETQFYVSELCVALDHLHQMGIIYRDLKLENVMLDQDGHICLTDFGLSKEFKPTDILQRTNSYCGTIEYMAPEVIRRPEGGYSEIVDWWSLGVFTFELLTGCSPFTVEGSKNTSKEIAERILSKPVPFPRTFHQVAKDLVTKLLVKDPACRLGAKGGLAEIQAHKFFEGIDFKSLIKRDIKPPYKPKLNSSIDVQYFAQEFTRQEPIVSPDQAPNTAMNKQLFRGYSFVSPSILLSADNVIGSDCINDQIGLNIQSLGEQQGSPFFEKYTLDMSRRGFLGRGAFSVCRRCLAKDTNGEFCVKIVSQRFRTQAYREAQILSACQQHKNIVRLYDAIEDQFHVYLVMELLQGDELLTKIKKSKQFTESEASRIARRLVSALKFLHERGIVHRDLKPENIIFESNDERSELRIIDFGFSRLVPRLAGNDKPLTTPCYTLHYAAPEVFERSTGGWPFSGQQHPLAPDHDQQRQLQQHPLAPDLLPAYNEQCDLWSLGVVVYIMLCGHAPFQARSKTDSAGDIMRRIRNAEFSFDGTEWTGVTEDAKDFISGLLTVDPEERLTVIEASEHPWLQTGHASDTSLATPNILANGPDTSFNETFRAFLTANRDGFHLADVLNAPLAQRRRRKQRVSSEDSGYTSSVSQQQQQLSGHLGSITTTPGSSYTGSPLSAEATIRTTPSGPLLGISSDPNSACASSRKRKLLTVIEERKSPTTTSSLNVSSTPTHATVTTVLMPEPSMNLKQEMVVNDDAFNIYRESPESIRSTVDFSTVHGIRSNVSSGAGSSSSNSHYSNLPLDLTTTTSGNVVDTANT